MIDDHYFSSISELINVYYYFIFFHDPIAAMLTFVQYMFVSVVSHARRRLAIHRARYAKKTVMMPRPWIQKWQIHLFINKLIGAKKAENNRKDK
jgi:hypothetical protein